MYAFLFDRRSMMVLLLVLTISSVLLFASGVVVGTGFTSTRHINAELSGGGERPATELAPEVLIDLIAGPAEPTDTSAPSVASEASSTSPSEPAPRTDSPGVSPAPSAETSDSTPSSDASVSSAPSEGDSQELVEQPPADEDPVAAPGAAAEEPVDGEAPTEEEPSGDTVWASYVLSRESKKEMLTTYSVQVGAYGREPNARRHMLVLEGRGFDPYSVPVAGNGRPLFTVRIGRFESRAEAEQAAEEYRVREGGSAFVRTDSTGAEL